MRYLVLDFIKDFPISESYFSKILQKCGVLNRIYLDENDLIKISENLIVSTYKTKLLYEQIIMILESIQKKCD